MPNRGKRSAHAAQNETALQCSALNTCAARVSNRTFTDFNRPSVPNSTFCGSASLALALAGFLMACGGDSTAPNAPAEIVVTPVDTLRSIGATATMTAVVRNAKHEPIPGVGVSWTSSNPAVATVDATTGLATAVANGKVTISAHAGALTGSASVTVQQALAVLTIVPTTDTLRSLGATSQYRAVARDAGGSPISAPVVNWTTTDAAVVTIGAQGLATAISNGSV